MEIKNLKLAVTRAWVHSFGYKRLAFCLSTLALCIAVTLFFRVLGLGGNRWVSFFLTLFPCFLSFIFLLGGGVFLIRLYHHEIKGVSFSFKQILWDSKERMVLSAAYGIPFALVYIFLAVVLGAFLLFHKIPLLGPLLNPLFTMTVFLVVLSLFFVLIAVAGILFFLPPLFALRSDVDKKAIFISCKEKFKRHLFSQLLFFISSCAISFCVFFLLMLAYIFTEALFFTSENLVLNTFSTIFVMVPFAVFLSPTLAFFFNLAAEAHVWSVLENEKRDEPPGGEKRDHYLRSPEQVVSQERHATKVP